VHFWVLELEVGEVWDLAQQEMLAKVGRQALQMGWTAAEGRREPRRENHRVPLPHLAHHQTRNRPLSVYPHPQVCVLWHYVSCEV
jgi:hypothetical protein